MSKLKRWAAWTTCNRRLGCREVNKPNAQPTAPGCTPPQGWRMPRNRWPDTPGMGTLITGHLNFSNWIAVGDEVRGRKWDDALRE